MRNCLLKRRFPNIYIKFSQKKKKQDILSSKYDFRTKVIKKKKKKTQVGSTKVRREYFGLSKLEKEHPNRLFIYIGNTLNASVRNGFSGILVDLFCKGSFIPKL